MRWPRCFTELYARAVTHTPDPQDGDDARTTADAAIRGFCKGGDYDSATTQVIRHYGPELMGYLHATSGNADLATEAFAELGEDIWRGLAGFRWDASIRSWLYILARNALNQLRRDPRRRIDRNLPLSIAPDIEVVVRTATMNIQRTAVKDEFRVLRDELSHEDHELLLLRLDQKMSWKDIARVLGAGDGQDVDTRAAMLRKRYERVKDRLRELAIKHGIIER
jgi:RNA polymerase sigma-70 factor, ECF subfamily